MSSVILYDKDFFSVMAICGQADSYDKSSTEKTLSIFFYFFAAKDNSGEIFFPRLPFLCLMVSLLVPMCFFDLIQQMQRITWENVSLVREHVVGTGVVVLRRKYF